MRLTSILNFYSSLVSTMLTSRQSARSSRSPAKKKFLQRQVKTALRKSSNWGEFSRRPGQRYPVYETDLSVRTEIEGLPSPPEIPSDARISVSVAQQDELMGCMNPTSYGPTESHL